MDKHPFVEKYNPDNYQPEVYDFTADFSDSEISEIADYFNQQPIDQALNNLSHSVQSKYKKYKYKKRQKRYSALDKNTIKQKQIVDCYGYTIATSQILELLNIHHQIAFANTHSFVIAEAEKKPFIVDSYLPCISGPISPLTICHKDCLASEVFSINLYEHSLNNCKISSPNNFLRENPWIRFSKNANKLGSSDREDLQPNANPSLIVRTFEPKDGIRALYAFDNFKVKTANNKLTEAYLMTKELTTSYPDIDIRNRPFSAELLINKLGRLGLLRLATLAADNITEGRSLTDTISPEIWRSKQYLMLGRITASKTLQAESLQILENLSARPNLTIQQKRLIKGKITKQHRLYLPL